MMQAIGILKVKKKKCGPVLEGIGLTSCKNKLKRNLHSFIQAGKHSVVQDGSSIILIKDS